MLRKVPESSRTVSETSADETVRITMAAAEAQEAFGISSAGERRRLLRSIAHGIDSRRRSLIAVAHLETAIAPERLDAEVDRTVAQLRFLGDHGVERSMAEDHEPGFVRRSMPIGPVAVYAASNFPFAFSTAGTDTASALAAGCAVVVKAHSGHPVTAMSTAEVIHEAVAEAGVDNRVFQMVHGFDAGLALIDSPQVRAAAFTGSTAGGRALFDRANRRAVPIPFYGELGSTNAVVITQSALSSRGDQLVDGFIASFTMSRGQLCTKPGLVFVPAGSDFFERASAALDAQNSGGRMLTSSIADNYHAALSRAAAHADRFHSVEAGTLLQVPAQALREHRETSEEIFGPAAVIVEYTSHTHLTALLRGLEPALAAAIHATEEDEAWLPEMVRLLSERSGRLVWNGWPTGVAVNATMHHGGRWPSSTAPLHTSVGAHAVDRFLVPIVYQGFPEAALPSRWAMADNEGPTL